MQGTYAVGRGEKSLLCDLGSELRLYCRRGQDKKGEINKRDGKKKTKKGSLSHLGLLCSRAGTVRGGSYFSGDGSWHTERRGVGLTRLLQRLKDKMVQRVRCEKSPQWGSSPKFHVCACSMPISSSTNKSTVTSFRGHVIMMSSRRQEKNYGFQRPLNFNVEERIGPELFI